MSVVFALRYGASDPAAYFLAPMALGLAALPAALAIVAPGPRVTEWAAVALVAAGVVLAVPWVRTALQRDDTYRRFANLIERMWSAIPFERGFVLWDDVMSPRLLILQELRGQKPGITVVHPTLTAHPVARRRFAARFGFDPVGGDPSGAWLERVALGINARTPLPVVVFDPSVPTVRMLRKSGAEAAR